MGGGSCACTASARRKIISVAVKIYLNEIELSAGSDGQGDYPLQVREDECEQRLARTMREPIVSGSSDPKDGRRKRKDGKQDNPHREANNGTRTKPKKRKQAQKPNEGE